MVDLDSSTGCGKRSNLVLDVQTSNCESGNHFKADISSCSAVIETRRPLQDSVLFVISYQIFPPMLSYCSGEMKQVQTPGTFFGAYKWLQSV